MKSGTCRCQANVWAFFLHCAGLVVAIDAAEPRKRLLLAPMFNRPLFARGPCADRAGSRAVRLPRIGLGPVDADDVFPGDPGHPPAAGNRVLVTRVPPIAGVEGRARRLGEQILAAFPDEPVHLIGHSMGGLDARGLLADPAWRGRILSLTTIGTPHLGSRSPTSPSSGSAGSTGCWSGLGIDPPRLPGHDPARRRGGSTSRIPPPDGRAVLQRRGRPDRRGRSAGRSAGSTPSSASWRGRTTAWSRSQSATGLRHPPARTGPSIISAR